MFDEIAECSAGLPDGGGPNPLIKIKLLPRRFPQFAGAREDKWQQPQGKSRGRVAFEPIDAAQEGAEFLGIGNRSARFDLWCGNGADEGDGGVGVFHLRAEFLELQFPLRNGGLGGDRGEAPDADNLRRADRPIVSGSKSSSSQSSAMS